MTYRPPHGFLPGHRLLTRVVIVASIAVALAAFLIYVTGCSAEATATNEVDEDRWSTEVPDARFYDDAQLLLDEMDGPDTDRTDLGVIIGENEDDWGSDWVVLTHAGEHVLLEPAINCDDDSDTTDEGDLWQLLDPGDLIIWTLTGDDTRVCTAEVTIARKAAVTPGG